MPFLLLRKMPIVAILFHQAPARDGIAAVGAHNQRMMAWTSRGQCSQFGPATRDATRGKPCVRRAIHSAVNGFPRGDRRTQAD